MSHFRTNPLGLVGENIPMFTTVHRVQVMPELPQDLYDVAVDEIVTPGETIMTHRKGGRPSGIFWDRVDDNLLEEMPILKELRNRKRDS